jgi:hypothetical protein
MAVKSVPTDQYHIEKCETFCAAVEDMIAADERIQTKKDSDTGRRGKRLTYIEAVLAIAEKNRIEPDLAAHYLNPEIKEKLRIDYENIHWLPRSAKLPF